MSMPNYNTLFLMIPSSFFSTLFWSTFFTCMANIAVEKSIDFARPYRYYVYLRFQYCVGHTT